MSGSCYSCASQFGYFKKEHGCKNCGYSFCKDCVTKKICVPKHNNEKHKVCDRCFDIISGKIDPKNQQAKYSPPEALKKRLAALENKESKPTGHDGMNKQKSTAMAKTQGKYKGMSKEDIVLAERLEKLKEERRKDMGSIPSQSEIEQRLEGLKDKGPPPIEQKEIADRLAILKGQDPTKKSKPFAYQPDRRSQQAQIDDLLDEICDEVEIDSHGMDAVGDIDSRLKHLKGQDENNLNRPELGKDDQYEKNLPLVTKEEQTASSDDVNINEINSLMKQVAQEMELDAQRAIAGLEKDKELMERLSQLKKERKKNPRNSDECVNDVNKERTELNIKPTDESDSENEEEAIKKILKQSLEEIKLDEDLSASSQSQNSETKSAASSSTSKKKHKSQPLKPSDDEQESDPDEFPWCCICNEDATIRCLGCDYDLYCKRCYKEGHDLLDMKEHKTVAFKQKGS